MLIFDKVTNRQTDRQTDRQTHRQTDRQTDRQIDRFRYSHLYNAYKSKESLGASVAKKMCFQRSSKRIEGKSWAPKPGWKVIPQSRTGSRETPVHPSRSTQPGHPPWRGAV